MFAENFKCRSSAIGKIMTEPKKKSEPLSETCKTYLKEWLTEKRTGRRKEFTSKETDKGIRREDEAIELISKRIGIPLQKNLIEFENEYLTGTPDVIYTAIRDIKCSWDPFTFPTYCDEIPTKDYLWQGLGYMDLTGRKHFYLDYVLMDHLDSYIDYMANTQARHEGVTSVNRELWDRVAKQYQYGDIPEDRRVKTFYVVYDENKIERIYSRVRTCREYLHELEVKYV